MNTTIDRLSSTRDLDGDDQFAVYQARNASTRKVSLETMALRVAEMIVGETDETQYNLAVPGGAFSLAVMPAAQGGSVWAQLTLTAPVSAATITLPAEQDRREGQEVLVTVTNSVASLTVAGNGVPVNGAPASLGVNGFFRLRFDSASNAWFRVG